METLEINKNNYTPLANRINLDGSPKYFKDEAARIDITGINDELNSFMNKVNSGNTYKFNKEFSVIKTKDHIEFNGENYDIFTVTGFLDNWIDLSIKNYKIEGILRSSVTVIENFNNIEIEYNIDNSFALNKKDNSIIVNKMIIDPTDLKPKLFSIVFYGKVE